MLYNCLSLPFDEHAGKTGTLEAFMLLKNVEKIPDDTRSNENPRKNQEESKSVQVSRSLEGPNRFQSVAVRARCFYRQWDRT